MFFRRAALRCALFFVTLVLVALPGNALRPQQNAWRLVREGMAYNISGMAVIDHTPEQTRYFVVHDNKRDGEGRAGIVTARRDAQPAYEALEWPKDRLPKDLEAVCAVPDAPSGFLALASNGTFYHVRLDASAKRLTLMREFKVKNTPASSNFEGVSLTKMGGRLLMTWAHRGQDAEPGRLYWCLPDLAEPGTFHDVTPLGSAEVRVTYPTHDLRHVSDLRVDGAGIVYVSSASDPGDEGPFESAVYAAGAFTLVNGVPVYTAAPAPTRLVHVPTHKVEAIEIVPGGTGGLALGSDDELKGGWLDQEW